MSKVLKCFAFGVDIKQETNGICRSNKSSVPDNIGQSQSFSNSTEFPSFLSVLKKYFYKMAVKVFLLSKMCSWYSREAPWNTEYAGK